MFHFHLVLRILAHPQFETVVSSMGTPQNRDPLVHGQLDVPFAPALAILLKGLTRHVPLQGGYRSAEELRFVVVWRDDNNK